MRIIEKHMVSKLCYIISVAVTLSTVMTNRLIAYDEPNNTYFPLLIPPSYIYGISTYGGNAISGMSDQTMIMLESLQGLLLKHGYTEGIHIETDAFYTNNFNDLVSRRQLAGKYEYVISPKTPWWLVQHFKAIFGSRYILYDLTKPDSLNAARMASYKYDAIMVEKTIESTALTNGLTKVLDVSNYTDQWIYDNWLPTWPRKDMAIDQFTTGTYRTCLNDYAAAIGAMCFHEPGGTNLRLAFLDALEDDSPVLGWMDTAYGELYSTLDNSKHNTHWTAVNTTHNTALYSAFRKSSMWPLHQNTHSSIVTRPNTHYVTFVWSDGDNMSWQIWGVRWHSYWWANSYRGQVSIGWPLNTPVRDLMQTSAEYLYATATNLTSAKDYFIAVGPNGYGYPAYFSTETRATNARRLAKYMQDLDLNILLLLDKSGFSMADVYTPYLTQSQIDAIFYWDVWGDYAKYKGSIKWVNAKPIISAYAIMDKTGVGGSTPTQIAAAIKARPQNPYSPAGYTMIGVNLWDDTVQDIVSCANLLGSGYKVVTPEEFVSLIKQNLHPTLKMPQYSIDLGSSQIAPYGSPTLPSFTITTNNSQQTVDGTPSTRFTNGTEYAYSNMNFQTLNITNACSFDADIWGDGSGSKIRLELYSSQYGSFLYSDITLDFNGWRHFSWNPDGIDMLYYSSSATLSQTLSSINLFQVSVSWNNIPATFFIDNVQIMIANPADFNGNGIMDFNDVAFFALYWLSTNSTVDLNHDNTVDFKDWAKFSAVWFAP